QKIDRLVADLDSDEFGVRERATADLEKLGPQAEPALQKALKETTSAEGRRRAAALLDKLAGAVDSTERLQALRAIEVLERINDREARRLLEELAGGLPGAWLTREAEQALQRLTRQSPPAP